MRLANVITGVALFILGATNTHVFAQQTAEAESVEHVEVQAESNPRALLKKYRRSRNVFIRHYNAIVKGTSNVVRCKYKKETGTRIKTRVCAPISVGNAVRSETQRQLSFAGLQTVNALTANVMSQPQLKQQIDQEMSEFSRLTAQLVKEHPELGTKFKSMEDALAEYEASR